MSASEARGWRLCWKDYAYLPVRALGSREAAQVVQMQKAPDLLKPVEEEKQEVQPVAAKPLAFDAYLLG